MYIIYIFFYPAPQTGHKQIASTKFVKARIHFTFFIQHEMVKSSLSCSKGD